jgi:hypothetical protein
MKRSIFERNFIPVNGITSVDDVLKAIGADFTVTKRDMFIANSDNENETEAQRAAGYSAMVREDNEGFLGVVSSNYGIVQYRKAVEPTQELVQNKEAGYGYGHVYNLGERLYLTMTDGAEADLGNGVKVKSYFTLVTSHDGTVGFEISPTFVNVQTGAVLTFNSSGKVWTKHSKHVDGRIATLRHRLSKVRDFFTEFVDTTRKLGTVKLSAADAESFLKEIIPGDSTRSANIRDGIISGWMAGPQAIHASCNGTLLGLYLAFCNYADNDKTLRRVSTVKLQGRRPRLTLRRWNLGASWVFSSRTLG